MRTQKRFTGVRRIGIVPMHVPFQVATVVVVCLMAPSSSAQLIRVTPDVSPPPRQPAGSTDAKSVLWDQSGLGIKAWIDQVFVDLPGYDTYQVSDVSTGVDTWKVLKVTAWYTQGFGSWDPSTITTASLSVFPKSGPVPDDASDVVPEYTVPATLTSIGDGKVWELTADTSAIEELYISGEFWIGITPDTSWAQHKQEYRLVASYALGDTTAVRNPGGSLSIGTAWMPLSTLDSSAAGFDASLRLEGELYSPPPPPPPPGWTILPGTELPSQYWSGLLPTLSGAGSAAAGSTITLSALLAGAPGDVAALVVGSAFLGAQFHGGTLVPTVDLISLQPVGIFGVFNVSSPWPSGVPGGSAIYFQTWTHELGGTLGWSASNGLALVTP
jgi:hypothetical protein